MKTTGLEPRGMTILLALCVGLLGCLDGSGAGAREQLGQARISLKQVPSDVLCIEVSISAGRVITRHFDVVPGEPSERTLTGLPLGSALFTAQAYGEACDSTSQASEPTWISNEVTARLRFGQTPHVLLTLRRPGSVVVEVDFQEEPPDPGSDSGVPTCTPIGNFPLSKLPALQHSELQRLLVGIDAHPGDRFMHDRLLRMRL